MFPLKNRFPITTAISNQNQVKNTISKHKKRAAITAALFIYH